MHNFSYNSLRHGRQLYLALAGEHEQMRWLLQQWLMSLDSEDQEEEDLEEEEEEGKGEGDDAIAVVVQWYGNNTAETAGYGPNSTYWPGWRDSGDLEHPLIYRAKRPKVCSSVRGPVFRYSAVVPASSVVLYGFVLDRGKLQSDTKRALADSDHG